MFGLGKKQKTIQDKHESESSIRSRKERALERLFDLGFLGKPEYYSNGDMQTDYTQKIWKPVSEKYRIYLDGVVCLSHEEPRYRFRIAYFNEGWLIPLHWDYLFVSQSELEASVNKSLINSINQVINERNKFDNVLKEIKSSLGINNGNGI